MSKISKYLSNRPKSIRFIVTYSVAVILFLTIIQILYVIKIVPLTLDQLSNMDPFTSIDTVGDVSSSLSNLYKFAGGFSSGLVATLVEACFIACFRLNKPYRTRSFAFAISMFFLALLMVSVLTYALIVGRQPLNADNLGSLSVFVLTIPLMPYLFRKVVRSWSKSIEPEFPKNIDLNS